MQGLWEHVHNFQYEYNCCTSNKNSRLIWLNVKTMKINQYRISYVLWICVHTRAVSHVIIIIAAKTEKFDRSRGDRAGGRGAWAIIARTCRLPACPHSKPSAAPLNRNTTRNNNTIIIIIITVYNSLTAGRRRPMAAPAPPRYIVIKVGRRRRERVFPADGPARV